VAQIAAAPVRGFIQRERLTARAFAELLTEAPAG